MTRSEGTKFEIKFCIFQQVTIIPLSINSNQNFLQCKIFFSLQNYIVVTSTLIKFLFSYLCFVTPQTFINIRYFTHEYFLYYAARRLRQNRYTYISQKLS